MQYVILVDINKFDLNMKLTVQTETQFFIAMKDLFHHFKLSIHFTTTQIR